jgi:hypothetical protein
MNASPQWGEACQGKRCPAGRKTFLWLDDKVLGFLVLNAWFVETWLRVWFLIRANPRSVAVKNSELTAKNAKGAKNGN